ncbi:MAG: S8 family peptidase [Bdellovibrionota bacterium]
MMLKRVNSWGGRAASLATGLTALLGLATSSFAAEYVVKLKAEKSVSSFAGEMKNLDGIKVKDTHATGRLVAIDTGANKENQDVKILQKLSAMPEVEYIVPNIKLHMFDTPNDPKFSEQWALTKVNAPQAWDTNVGSRNVVVAVIDTGIDWHHADLSDNIWTNPGEIPGNNIDDDNNGFVDDVHGWDFNAGDNDPMDETSQQNPGHGTHCAGIVGGVGNNNTGISGMSQEITIMPVRFLGANGSGDLMAGAKAVDYAVSNGAHIISASWGAAVQESQIKPILEAIERADQAGVIFVAAAANDGKNNDTRAVFPANSKSANVISVAASDPQDGKPSWSNYGKATVHLASPGQDILSTLPNSYGKLSGTSMATPLVAGLVGLMKAQAMAEGRDLNGAQARSILQTTGAPVNIETACDCRVDANEAVNFIRDNKIAVVPAAATLAAQATKTFTGIGGTEPYKFTSSNPAVATVTESGQLQAVANGETVLTMTDANGSTVQSKKIYVGSTPDNGGGGGGGEACPFEDPNTCLLMCLMNPELPWCEDLPLPTP